MSQDVDIEKAAGLVGKRHWEHHDDKHYDERDEVHMPIAVPEVDPDVASAISLPLKPTISFSERPTSIHAPTATSTTTATATATETSTTSTTAAHILSTFDTSPLHPYNWPNTARWRTVLTVALGGFIGTCGSSIIIPGLPAAMAEFGTRDHRVGILVASFYVLGMG